MPWRQSVDLASFNPETVQLLSDAVERALAILESQGQVLDREGCRLALAKHIVQLAKGGERSPENLVAGAVAAFSP